MANYGYGWYTQEQLEDYYDQLIGKFFNILSIFTVKFVSFSVIFLRRLCRDSEAGDLHRRKEDKLPGGSQVRGQPRLER